MLQLASRLSASLPLAAAAPLSAVLRAAAPGGARPPSQAGRCQPAAMYGTAVGQGTYDAAAATKGAALHSSARAEAPAGGGGPAPDIIQGIKNDHARCASKARARAWPAGSRGRSLQAMPSAAASGARQRCAGGGRAQSRGC
jgi:hypothetical protein